MNYITKIITGALFTLMLFFGLQAPMAQAVSDADIRSQTTAVQTALMDTLQEHLKLLQLVFIQRLEAEVATLQARL